MVSRNTVMLNNGSNSAIQFCENTTTPEGKVIPDILLFIQRVWKCKADKYGDKGIPIVGSVFLFKYDGKEYIMPPISPWQGHLSWEHCLEDINIMLDAAGAADIQYDRGVFDYSQP